MAQRVLSVFPAALSVRPKALENDSAGGLYLYNAVSNKWQYLNSYTDGIITADTAGRYLLTNQNLKFANINWTFFIAGGVVVVLIGIAYVVLKKRYWFW